MGYFDYLKELLRPLGVYSLDDGYGAAELYALGQELDGCCEKLQAAETESIIPTATGAGLEAYEALVTNIPAYTGIKTRRQALMGLIQIDDTCFTRDALCRILSGCGLPAQVDETDEKYVVAVSFPKNRGIPENFEAIKARVEEILPCHLNVEYILSYPTWGELEAAYPTWADTVGLSWSDLESYGSED
jgi:hypothetical protein